MSHGPGSPSRVKAFLTCGACRRAWSDERQFLIDPELRLLGFQGHARIPESNLLVFEHRCGSSVSVLARRLRHLLPQVTTGDRVPVLYGTDACGGFCRTLEDLSACERRCANAGDRALVRLVIEMRRTSTTA